MGRRPRALVLAGALIAADVGLAAAAAAPAAAATTYTITDLGSLGYGVTEGLAINATGQVTGYSYLSTTYTIPCNYPSTTKCTAHPYHAFVYANGTMTDLGTLGGHNSGGEAINLSGQVAGWAETKSGGHDAALWTGKKTVDVGALGPLAGSFSEASGINDSGQVVGSWAASVTGFDAASRPFLYSNGTITSLSEPGDLAGAPCQARAINNTGQIAGACLDTSGTGHLVLWQNGTVTHLGTIGDIRNFAYLRALSINSNGQIAGWAATATGSVGFSYSSGTFTSSGTTFSANAINDKGVMVGGSSIDSGGTVQDLNTLIPANSGYQITYATAINNNGQIAAIASNATVLLNPS